MSSQEIMQEINQLLDDIVTRTLEINKKDASGDALLDIDLAQDDIRFLYRRLEALRGIISERARMEPSSDAPSPKKEMKSSGPAHEDQPTTVREPEPTPSQGPASTRENQDSSYTPEKAEKTPDSGRASVEPGRDPGTEHSVDSPVRHQQPDEGVTQQDRETGKPPERPEPQRYAPAAEPRAERQQQDQPAAHMEPVKEDHQRQQAQTPPQPKAKNNNDNRAVIDIFSEYSDRTIGDAYLKEQDDSLHKRISVDKEDKSIGERMQKQPVANLKDAIGINEKFLFINELFDGDIQDYQEAIARLNDMENARAAFDYLNTLGVEHAWDAARSADTIEKLAQLVHRRYL